MASAHANMIVWIDETGTDSRDCHCCCGYHMRGTTPVNHILNVRGKRISVITAMSTRGIENIHVAQNTVDGDTFLHFVQNCLVPILQPFDGTNPLSVVGWIMPVSITLTELSRPSIKLEQLSDFYLLTALIYNPWKKSLAKLNHF